MDKHLELLSKKHLETKFIKIHAEKAPFLAEKLKIWMLPTVALIKARTHEGGLVAGAVAPGTCNILTSLALTSPMTLGALQEGSLRQSPF